MDFTFICAVCPKTILEQKGDTIMFACPKCKRLYNRYHEIMNRPDRVHSVYDEESNIELAGLNAGTPGLLSANDSDFPSLDEQYEQERNKGKIPVPKYMKNGPTTTVEHFEEEVI